ncbi:3-oxoacyl-ACP synthase [Allosalinactinospora lopnorensis]|uniref:3-oxoacyl-ACP synthase n=1 Tax=Allosalinactinospora lopnorensis TaxID=1352348 RepID=UPI000623D9DD|nr:3-oxoacyl-ACP synthase [Allosalinactinospora lopnorensis]
MPRKRNNARGQDPRWEGKGIHFRGFGLYYPEKLVMNEPGLTDDSGNEIDASVLGRVQVKSRHVSNEKETVARMAAEAGGQAVQNAGISPSDLDLIILSNWTTPPYTPEYGPEVASLLGTPRTLAYDISGACTGFVHGVQSAAAYLHSIQGPGYALVTCSEQFSRRARPGSKGELVCGDAAGAAVLEKRDDGGTGLIDSTLRSDGDRASVVSVPTDTGWVRSQRDLADHAVAGIVEACSELLDRSGLRMSDIDWVVPHPGTDVVHNRVRGALGVPETKLVLNFQVRGNTTSASIPIVLAEKWDAGLFRPGDLVLSPAIGAGWYSGALLYRI